MELSNPDPVFETALECARLERLAATKTSAVARHKRRWFSLHPLSFLLLLLGLLGERLWTHPLKLTVLLALVAFGWLALAGLNRFLDLRIQPKPLPEEPLQALALELGGRVHREKGTARVLDWLNRHWADREPAWLTRNTDLCFASIEADYRGDDLLIVAACPDDPLEVSVAILLASHRPCNPSWQSIDRAARLEFYPRARNFGVILTRRELAAGELVRDNLAAAVRAAWDMAQPNAHGSEPAMLPTRPGRARIPLLADFLERERSLNGLGLMSWRQRVMCAALTAPWLLLCVGSAVGAFTMLGTPPPLRVVDLWIPFLLLLMFSSEHFARKYWRDALRGEVKVITGMVHFEHSSRGPGTIRCGTKSFMTFQTVPDDVYRLYYARHSELLLDIEPVFYAAPRCSAKMSSAEG